MGGTVQSVPVNPMERLTRLARSPSRTALGLMSGMSRDGVDVAHVRIEDREDGGVRVHPLHVASHGYPEDLEVRVRAAEAAGPAALCEIERDLTMWWSAWIERYLESLPAGVPPPYVIGSHGQTIYHRPREGERAAATLQIGDGDLLAQRLGITTVSDFRRRDIAAGGEGAPLIPMADWLLFAEPGRTVACNNLGSISNVTVVSPRVEDLLAFDTGPANVLIDAFARRAAGDIDRDGALSARGSVDDDLLLWFYTQRAAWLAAPPPKSAGFETFQALVDGALDAHPGLSVEDLTRTAVEFTARTIRDAYENFVLTRYADLKTVRLSGGGCRNPTLMAAIRHELGALGLEVSALPPAWVDGKEAIGFALLADLTVRGLAGNHPGATGATERVVLGKISL